MKRLKTRNQFQAAMAGRTLARTPHFALHCAPLDTNKPAVRNDAAVPQLEPLGVQESSKSFRVVPSRPLFGSADVWMGAMVPKRWAKRAVTRTAIKRQIYSISARLQGDLEIAAHVVRLRAGFDKATFPSAASDALKAAVGTELTQLFAIATRPSKKTVTAPTHGMMSR